MSDAYDVTSFELDYCQADVSKIAAAIKAKSSLLVIGMPGCGKSRLINFLLHRPGILEKYGLPNNLKSIVIDCDIVANDPYGIYVELLQALGSEIHALGESNLNVLKNRLIVEVGKLERDIDLIIVFDNFNLSLQQALGENFFRFLFALRNNRPMLNISYIFMANLKIDFSAFQKTERLFDKGADRSICWLSLLNQKDTFFSIERQWRKDPASSDAFSATDRERIKQRIYELTGGHALLTRYLSHLMLGRDVSLETKPERILEHGGIRVACTTIWNDLEQNYKNLLIDLAKSNNLLMVENNAVNLLKNYELLTSQGHFFSPLFTIFVKGQDKASEVVNVRCDGTKTTVIITTVDQAELSFRLSGIAQRKRSLLCYLLANQDEACAKDQLIEAGWPAVDKRGVSDQALSRQMEDLRKWLNQQPQLSQYLAIETIWQVGYKLVIKN